MAPFQNKLTGYQEEMGRRGIDGWLLYDFRRSNDLACQILELDPSQMLTRRFFYWVPAEGVPVKVVHKVEMGHLDHLPGELAPYASWRELEQVLARLLEKGQVVAMEYSPRNGIPYVSKVDGGTLELVREYGVEVVSSADLLSRETLWGEREIQLHLEAAAVLEEAVEKAWVYIEQCLDRGQEVTEYAVQQYILETFASRDCVATEGPIVAVNAHAADPHYLPSKECHSAIEKGQFVLIDLWCKKKEKGAVYADITRVGMTKRIPSSKEQEVFEVVREARDQAIALVKQRFASGDPLMGWEVDQAARDVIEAAGYGAFFTHRLGHNIGINDHGDGAHLDNFETQDRRLLLPGTCFSIEPGIYLPGEFGVRLEYDVLVHPCGKVQVTGGIQEQLRAMF